LRGWSVLARDYLTDFTLLPDSTAFAVHGTEPTIRGRRWTSASGP
jgi:hypothetical protein